MLDRLQSKTGLELIEETNVSERSNSLNLEAGLPDEDMLRLLIQ
jgi:hypothetical protein